MTEKTGPEKPEWFALADGDTPSAQVRKVNKKLPALAVLVTGAVIATGAFFANASEEKGGDDFAPAPSINQIDNTTGSNPNITSPNVTNPKPATGVTSPESGVQDPTKGGVLPPQERGEDGDDDHEWGDREEREGHEGRERGEHRQGEKAPTIPSTTTSKSA